MKITYLLFAALLFTGVGCARQTTRDSALTPGMTKKYIYPGKTTQTEVLEIFGPPNIITHTDGDEVWTYDQISQEIKVSQGFLTILFAGYSSAKSRSHSKSILLMIYFDKNEKVKNYVLHATQF